MNWQGISNKFWTYVFYDELVSLGIVLLCMYNVELPYMHNIIQLKEPL